MSIAVAHDDRQDDGEMLRLLRDAAATFAKRSGVGRSRALRKTRPGFDRPTWKQMAEQGWLGILIPENFGGQGLGAAEMAVVVEELARTLAPEPVVACAVLAATVIAASDNEAIKTVLLPKIAAGESIVGVALAGRFAFDKTEVTARKSGSDILLAGQVHHVYPVHDADEFLVAARDGGELVLCRVNAKAAGLSCREELRADSTFAGTLTLKDVKVSASDVVARGARAEAALRRGVDAAVITSCAELCGIMDQALDMTLQYLRTRVQFGKPIGSFQALQHRTVDLWIQKELSAGALGDAVRTLDDPQASADEISMIASRAKSRCGDAAHTIGREAIKLHGAIGYTDEYDVGLYLRRAMTINAWLGNPAEHRRRFGRLLRQTGGASEKVRASVPFSAVFLSDDKADVDWNSFSDDEFRAGVFAWFDKNYPHDMRHMGRRGSADEMNGWMKRVSRKGWIAPAWPVEWGGMGLSPAKQLIYIEERERVGVMRDPDMGIVMFGPMLMRWGTDEQKRKYLPSYRRAEGHLVPGLFRAERRLRPRRLADHSGARR